ADRELASGGPVSRFPFPVFYHATTPAAPASVSAPGTGHRFGGAGPARSPGTRPQRDGRCGGTLASRPLRPGPPLFGAILAGAHGADDAVPFELAIAFGRGALRAAVATGAGRCGVAGQPASPRAGAARPGPAPGGGDAATTALCRHAVPDAGGASAVDPPRSRSGSPSHCLDVGFAR